MDTGVQLAKGGLHTVVLLDECDLPSAQSVVVSTDSRDVPAVEAQQRAGRAALCLQSRALYKKIDSTLRGNIGPELDGILDALGLERALVAPAFPSAGRTTVDGCHRVNGVLLAESVFADDPLWPAVESHLPTILARQTRRSVGYLPLSVVEMGEDAVAEALRLQSASVVAADAVEVRHLRTLARALVRLEETWLPCGSAGLAEEWPLALGIRQPDVGLFRWPKDRRPVLVLAGSRSPATARQLHRTAGGGVALVRVSPEDDWDCKARVEVLPLLSDGRDVAVTTSFSEYREGQASVAAELLAQMSAWLLDRSAVSGLVMTGGDVARAVCRFLGAGALRVLGEVQPGVPAGTLVGGPHDGLRIVTKAGGFGDDSAILESIQRIHGG